MFRYHYSYLSKTRAQFVPPKPKLLDMARVNGPSFLLSVCSSPLLDIPLSNYEGIWNSHVGSLPLRISGTWHSIVRLTAVCRHPDKIHVCHVSPRSTREQRAHYLVHQLDSKTKLSKHTTSTSYRCLALVLGNLSQRTPRFPKKISTTTKKHAVDHQNPREHDLRHGPFLIIHQDSRSSHEKRLREPQKGSIRPGQRTR